MKPSLLLLTLSAVLPAATAVYGASNLVSQSPFLPPDFGAKPAVVEKAPTLPPEATDHFDFRGVMKLNDRYLFNIVDTRTNVSKWVDPSSPVNSFEIVSYNEETNEIEYNWNGSSGLLKLPEAERSPSQIIEYHKMVSGAPGGAAGPQSGPSGVNAGATGSNRVENRTPSYSSNGNLSKAPAGAWPVVRFGAGGSRTNRNSGSSTSSGSNGSSGSGGNNYSSDTIEFAETEIGRGNNSGDNTTAGNGSNSGGEVTQNKSQIPLIVPNRVNSAREKRTGAIN